MFKRQSHISAKETVSHLCKRDILTSVLKRQDSLTSLQKRQSHIFVQKTVPHPCKEKLSSQIFAKETVSYLCKRDSLTFLFKRLSNIFVQKKVWHLCSKDCPTSLQRDSLKSLQKRQSHIFAKETVSHFYSKDCLTSLFKRQSDIFVKKVALKSHKKITKMDGHYLDAIKENGLKRRTGLLKIKDYACQTWKSGS